MRSIPCARATLSPHLPAAPRLHTSSSIPVSRTFAILRSRPMRSPRSLNIPTLPNLRFARGFRLAAISAKRVSLISAARKTHWTIGTAKARKSFRAGEKEDDARDQRPAREDRGRGARDPERALAEDSEGRSARDHGPQRL